MVLPCARFNGILRCLLKQRRLGAVMSPWSKPAWQFLCLSPARLTLHWGGAGSFGISVRKARTLKAGELTYYIKDGKYRKSDSNLASFLMLRTLAVAALDEPLPINKYMLYLSVQCWMFLVVHQGSLRALHSHISIGTSSRKQHIQVVLLKAVTVCAEVIQRSCRLTYRFLQPVFALCLSSA